MHLAGMLSRAQSLTGSKFGGYGSFLPTYQRSPLLPQSESPHIALNISMSGSPYQPSAEVFIDIHCAVKKYMF